MSKDNKNQMAISDFNLQEIDTKQLEQHLMASIQAHSNVVVIGRRGSGKTMISKQIIEKSNKDILYINLSLFERVDLSGVPNIVSIRPQTEQEIKERRQKFIDYFMPRFYEKMMYGNKEIVCLMDEVDKADPSIWAPLLEIIQFKTINGQPLTNLICCIMTGNLISEGGQKPTPPLLDRSEKYLVQANLTAWLDWAGKSGAIHPSITAFLTDHGNYLFGATDPEGLYADPSPRGWELASRLLFIGEKNGWGTDILNEKVCGQVGKEAGLKYSAYYTHYQVLMPLIEKIFRGEDVLKEYNSLEQTKKLVACMITCQRLANILDGTKNKENKDKENTKENVQQIIKFVGKFLSKADYENILVSIRSQLTVPRILEHGIDETKDWKDFLTKINSDMEVK